jgi:hypothetical protein
MKFFAPWNEWACVDCYDDVVKKYKHVEKLAREREEHGLFERRYDIDPQGRISDRDFDRREGQH